MHNRVAFTNGKWYPFEDDGDKVQLNTGMRPDLIQMGVWGALATDAQPTERKGRMRVDRQP